MDSQIISTTISIVNQTAIPSLVRKKLELKPGDKLLWEVFPGSEKVVIKPSPRLWGTYMRGLGKNVWSNISPNRYIKQLRKDRKIL